MTQMKSIKENSFAQHLQTFEDIKDKVAEVGQIGMDIASISGMAKFGMTMKKMRDLAKGKKKGEDDDEAEPEKEGAQEQEVEGGAEEPTVTSESTAEEISTPGEQISAEPTMVSDMPEEASASAEPVYAGEKITPTDSRPEVPDGGQSEPFEATGTEGSGFKYGEGGYELDSSDVAAHSRMMGDWNELGDATDWKMGGPVKDEQTGKWSYQETDQPAEPTQYWRSKYNLSDEQLQSKYGSTEAKPSQSGDGMETGTEESNAVEEGATQQAEVTAEETTAETAAEYTPEATLGLWGRLRAGLFSGESPFQQTMPSLSEAKTEVTEGLQSMKQEATDAAGELGEAATGAGEEIASEAVAAGTEAAGASIAEAIPVVGEVIGVGLGIASAVTTGVEQAQETAAKASEAAQVASLRMPNMGQFSTIQTMTNTSYMPSSPGIF